MEKMTDAGLQWWCNETGVYSEFLTGFRRRNCTTDATMKLVTCVEHERSQGNITIAVCLDIKRRPETISHIQILISSLDLAGMAWQEWQENIYAD